MVSPALARLVSCLARAYAETSSVRTERFLKGWAGAALVVAEAEFSQAEIIVLGASGRPRGARRDLRAPGRLRAQARSLPLDVRRSCADRSGPSRGSFLNRGC